MDPPFRVVSASDASLAPAALTTATSQMTLDTHSVATSAVDEQFASAPFRYTGSASTTEIPALGEDAGADIKRARKAEDDMNEHAKRAQTVCHAVMTILCDGSIAEFVYF